MNCKTLKKLPIDSKLKQKSFNILNFDTIVFLMFHDYNTEKTTTQTLY